MVPPPAHDDTRERLVRIEEQLTGLRNTMEIRVISLQASVERLYKILGWVAATVGVLIIGAIMKPILGGVGSAAVVGGLLK